MSGSHKDRKQDYSLVDFDRLRVTRAERQKRQRAEEELKLATNKVNETASFLRNAGNCGVVLPSKNSPNQRNVIAGFKSGLLRNRHIKGNVMWLPADGLVQGQNNPKIDPAKFSQDMSEIRRGDSFFVVAFTDTLLKSHIGPDLGRGTNGILDRVIDLSRQEAEVPFRYRRLGFMCIANGKESDIPPYCPATRQAPTNIIDLMDRWSIVRENGEIDVVERHLDEPVDPPQNSGAENNIIVDFGGTELPR